MRSKNLIWTTSYSPRLDYILLERLDYILLERLDYILREGGGVRQRVRQIGFDRLGSTELCRTLELGQRFDRGLDSLSKHEGCTEVL